MLFFSGSTSSTYFEIVPLYKIYKRRENSCSKIQILTAQLLKLPVISQNTVYYGFRTFFELFRLMLVLNKWKPDKLTLRSCMSFQSIFLLSRTHFCKFLPNWIIGIYLSKSNCIPESFRTEEETRGAFPKHNFNFRISPSLDLPVCMYQWIYNVVYSIKTYLSCLRSRDYCRYW